MTFAFAVSPEPLAKQPSRFLSGEQQAFLVDSLRLHSGQVIDAELSYRIFHNNQGNPFEKPIIIVHKALTGTTNAFTDGEKTQGDGWGNHLKNLPHFDLNKHTILVVEPLGGNANRLSASHLCSGRDLYQADPAISVSSYDTVNLINRMLTSEGVNTVDNIFCFSMGGIMLPAWIEQKDLSVKSIHSIFSNYQLTSATREYWEIQLGLLDPSETKPDFKNIAEKLRNNFDLQPRDFSDTFSACVQYLAAKVEQLELVHDQFDSSSYLHEALKVVRGISFLRFQTKTNYNEKSIGKCLDFLDQQGECFPDRMDPINYVSLLKLMLDESFPSHATLREIKSRETKINYIQAIDDMLFPVENGCDSEACVLSDKTAMITTGKGHDGFLSKCFPIVVRWFL